MKKIGDSFKGILGGILLIIASIILLWWNEGNNVKNIKTTDEMSKTVIDIKSDAIDAKNEGKLVATYGKLVNEEKLTDKDFGVSIITPKMTRTVEMYQWSETEQDNDGEKSYTYSKGWSSEVINSDSFRKSGHDNPKSKPFEDTVAYSKNVSVGAFRLSPEQIEMLSTDGVFTDYNDSLLPGVGYHRVGDYLTNSLNYDYTVIGDIRIMIKFNNSTDISVLAVQTGDTFADFVSKVGKTHNRVVDGIHSGQDIINMIIKENKLLGDAPLLFLGWLI